MEWYGMAWKKMVWKCMAWQGEIYLIYYFEIIGKRYLIYDF
jgi:hypothetical protein